MVIGQRSFGSDVHAYSYRASRVSVVTGAVQSMSVVGKREDVEEPMVKREESEKGFARLRSRKLEPARSVCAFASSARGRPCLPHCGCGCAYAIVSGNAQLEAARAYAAARNCVRAMLSV